jgi:hypothetical protein
MALCTTSLRARAGHVGTLRRPVSVGAQEHRRLALGRLQWTEQVRRGDAGIAHRAMEARVQAALQRAGLMGAGVFRIQTGLGRNDGQQQLDIAFFQLALHATDQRQVVAQLALTIGYRIELLVRVQPAVLADYQAAAAFAERQVLQGGPEVDNRPA